MNRTQTSAIVLLLALGAAACEHDLEDDRPPAEVATKEPDGTRPRRLLSALLGWALGRTWARRELGQA